MKTATLHPARPYDAWFIAAILVLANVPLLLHGVADQFIFFPSLANEWWRLITYPLAHVSLYHLLLDAGAFLMLYTCLGNWNIPKRLGSLVLCSVFSLGAALLASSMPNGLCGLSGIAHGLMAIAALQMTREKTTLLRTAGLISFILVVAKSIHEGITGQICFEFLHFGSVGEAIAVCHTGGVLGGICAYLVFRKAPSAARSTDRPEFDQSDQTDRTD